TLCPRARTAGAANRQCSARGSTSHACSPTHRASGRGRTALGATAAGRRTTTSSRTTGGHRTSRTGSTSAVCTNAPSGLWIQSHELPPVEIEKRTVSTTENQDQIMHVGVFAHLARDVCPQLPI